MSVAHIHAHTGRSRLRTLTVSLALIAGFMLVEVVGGWWTNSLALLSDAGHMLSDAAALLLALLAALWGRKASTRRHTFGFRRVEVLAALFNGLTLLLIAALITYEALLRLQAPQPVVSSAMLAIAALGLAINLLVAWYMHRGGDVHRDLNLRAAYLHVLGDVLGSVAAIVAALLMMAFGWLWADAVCSLVVALLIVRAALATVYQAGQVLMEANWQVDTDAVLALLQSDERVQSVHDVHIWSIAGGMHALSCHVVVAEALGVAELTELQNQLAARLAALHIGHSAIQVEGPAHGHEERLWCSLPEASPPGLHTHHH